MLPGGSRVGDYEIESELGEGGMARVYRARHALLDTLHAVKVLDPELRSNADARQRFLDEARIQAKHLDHPGIVKVTNIVATSEHAALVMELIEGPSLEAHAASLVDNPGEIRRIMIGILEAVGHAHAAGIVHRDLKPANVLLAGKEPRTPKVTDFGIAKVSADPSRVSKKSTHAGARMGTLSYMSPEQIRRAKDVTPRSDIFSLGAMLYELATGFLPFEGDDDFEVMEKIVHARFVPPEERNPRIDPVFVDVIATALQADPALRYQTCAEMATALRARSGLTSTGPRASAVTPTEPPRLDPPRTSRTNLAVILALLGLCVIGVMLFLVNPGGSTNDDQVRPPVAADLAAYRGELGLPSGALSAQLETSMGTIHCQLAADKSPIAVANFIGLASGHKPWRDAAGRIHTKEPYYDGTAIYRVIPEFVVQGGRPATDLDTPSDPGYTFADEASDLTHLPGTLAMANRGPATNGGELLFLVEESKRLDGSETIIGQCKDLDVIRAISRVHRDTRDRPEAPLTIQRIRIGDEARR